MADDKKFIQKADLKKGRVRRLLGVPKGEKIPEKELATKISALRKKGEGEKKLTKSQRSLLSALTLARTFKSPGFGKKRKKSLLKKAPQ